MVTLRAYSNPTEAALAKSVLDDHNIFCSLADENAYLYGGAPFAMPVRLLVADEQAEEADHILKKADGDFADFVPTPDSEIQETIEKINQKRLHRGDQQLSPQLAAKNNPWEILAIASLLLLPGLVLLLQKHELILFGSVRGVGRDSITVFSPTTAHLFGGLVIAVVVLLTALFFYIRRAIMREQTAATLLRDLQVPEDEVAQAVNFLESTPPDSALDVSGDAPIDAKASRRSPGGGRSLSREAAQALAVIFPALGILCFLIATASDLRQSGTWFPPQRSAIEWFVAALILASIGGLFFGYARSRPQDI
jgi:hypothetical protein